MSTTFKNNKITFPNLIISEIKEFPVDNSVLFNSDAIVIDSDDEVEIELIIKSIRSENSSFYLIPIFLNHGVTERLVSMSDGVVDENTAFKVVQIVSKIEKLNLTSFYFEDQSLMRMVEMMWTRNDVIRPVYDVVGKYELSFSIWNGLHFVDSESIFRYVRKGEIWGVWELVGDGEQHKEFGKTNKKRKSPFYFNHIKFTDTFLNSIVRSREYIDERFSLFNDLLYAEIDRKYNENEQSYLFTIDIDSPEIKDLSKGESKEWFKIFQNILSNFVFLEEQIDFSENQIKLILLDVDPKKVEQIHKKLFMHIRMLLDYMVDRNAKLMMSSKSLRKAKKLN